jgi:hypothetical protein
VEKEPTRWSEDRGIIAVLTAIFLALVALMATAGFLLPSHDRANVPARGLAKAEPSPSGPPIGQERLDQEFPLEYNSSMLQPASGKQAIRVQVTVDGGKVSLEKCLGFITDLWASKFEPAKNGRKVVP